MQFTKAAYSINAEEIEVKSSGTITQNDIQNNVEVIDNINLKLEDDKFYVITRTKWFWQVNSCKNNNGN